jgi:hypothetical protein
MLKFPELIHVAIEHPENDDPYFTVFREGIGESDEDGQHVAVYKLVKVGQVFHDRRFVEKKGRK